MQVTDGALYRTKIHCYFLDQTRVVRQLAQEKNYHIFYQMLAGLTAEERARLSLEGYSVDNLRYLNRGDTRCNQAEDARRFANWKACLGISFISVAVSSTLPAPPILWEGRGFWLVGCNPTITN